jgi:hypothetical protein
MRWWHRDASSFARLAAWVLGVATLATGWAKVDRVSTLLLVAGSAVLVVGLALLGGERLVLGYALAIVGALLVPVGYGFIVTVAFLIVAVAGLASTARRPAAARSSDQATRETPGNFEGRR